MLDIPMKTTGLYNAQNIASINSQHMNRPIIFQGNILEINCSNVNHNESRSSSNMKTTVPRLLIPTLQKKIQKGQKNNLFSASPSPYIDAIFGWNVKNQNCDVDVSAFLLGNDGKVLGDSWFVFYGQPSSPDSSVTFSICNNNSDREQLHIDLSHIDNSVSKIVFVLTLNDARIKNLNFEMVEDAYIRINDHKGMELSSFLMTDYYSNVISMMIGEIYLHNGNWKFNAIGNGVAKDLAGLCELYGVQVN